MKKIILTEKEIEQIRAEDRKRIDVLESNIDVLERDMEAISKLTDRIQELKHAKRVE